MIQLHEDCLLFQTADGENIPFSAETITIELIGETSEKLDPLVIQQAASAVVFYFKNELGRTSVSIGEFSMALERVLNNLGFSVESENIQDARRVATADLTSLASSGDGFELGFFSRLRKEVREQLSASPEVLRFFGLRDCVKHLLGTKRWNGKCQALNDQIVAYVRECYCIEIGGKRCDLVVH